VAHVALDAARLILASSFWSSMPTSTRRFVALLPGLLALALP
jgi:hypothetical protein